MSTITRKSRFEREAPLVIQAARNGASTYSAAARIAGVPVATVLRWIKLGTVAENGPNVNTDAYTEFAELFERAREAYVQERLEQIKRAADEDSRYWNASAWLLERQFPERFGKRVVQHQVEGEMRKRYEFAEPEIPEPEMPRETDAEVVETNGHHNGNGNALPSPEDQP